MRLRVVAVTAAAIFVSPAAALADVTFQAVDGTGPGPADNRWEPNVATIKVGETVTWSFAGTASYHNVKGTDDWVLPNAPPAKVGNDPVTNTFTTPGTYEFFCTLHAASMRGTITVADEAGTLPPPPPPPPLSAQPFPNDVPAPTILEVRDTVVPSLDRVAVTRVRKGARVRFRLSEAGKVTIKLTRGGHAAKTRTVQARKGTSSATINGLRAGSYRVQVSATDLAGNAARASKRARVTVRS
jgi:plastocyanin